MSDSSFKPYDPMVDKDRLEFWHKLLVGKKIKSLILKPDKCAYGMGGVKKTHPAYIGFVLEGEDGKDTPVYVHPGAFGDDYGTFVVHFDDEWNLIYSPEEK